ncbi:hypothetical protein AURDEDRAFT_186014 [Auricularia subglabra TFB-10046 SS5]|nr:hypothetical protein AURDEDRAFT_186014 [Auricularia subglabra TFB-10046 SS5]
MLGELYLAFLGTSAGEGPTASRGAPCMLLHMGKEMWMVDCGDGATRQLASFRALHHPRAVLPGTSTEVDFRVPVTRVFITHLHPGHVAGLPLMLLRLMGEGAAVEEERERENPSPPLPPTSAGVPPAFLRPPHVTLIGPAGLRRFVRSALGTMRQAHTRGRYTVHELLFDDDTRTPVGNSHLLLPCELPGRDYTCDRGGLWREFDSALGGEVVISAAPVMHTVPSIGYVFTEKTHNVPRGARLYDPDSPPDTNGSSASDADDEKSGAGAGASRVRRVSFSLPPSYDHEKEEARDNVNMSERLPPTRQDSKEIFPGRKIVVLGDTCDPSSLSRLAVDATMVVHEATDTHLPHESSGAVRERVVARGHSTAQMAGAFAKTVRARHLILNHFCARFPAPTAPNDPKAAAMQALAAQASAQWGTRDPDSLVIAAKDFDIVAVPPETSTFAQARDPHPSRLSQHQRVSSASLMTNYGATLEPQLYLTNGQTPAPTLNRRPSISGQRGPSPPSAPAPQGYDLIPYKPQPPPTVTRRPSMSGTRGPSPPSAQAAPAYDVMPYAPPPAPVPPATITRRPSMSGQREPSPPSAVAQQQPYTLMPYAPAQGPPPTLNRRPSMSGQRGPSPPSAVLQQQAYDSMPYAPTPAPMQGPPPTVNRRPSMSGQRMSSMGPPTAYPGDPVQDMRQPHQRAQSQPYNYAVPASAIPQQQPRKPSPPTAAAMYSGTQPPAAAPHTLTGKRPARSGMKQTPSGGPPSQARPGKLLKFRMPRPRKPSAIRVLLARLMRAVKGRPRALARSSGSSEVAAVRTG